ncbi:MAG TPA: iron ABC transporter permease [Aquabacterium sp.]|uniref:FecCD family ABC transporter permease n=1 Tax=Aquabacterium sp. TaxID=1872578 RepID=UPI002E37A07B|nr:iron ABC transporter permease [Aquabacterium sp.]HEX5373514.1 iron ABC transporter permease [Aquabacterium sp.]
MSRPWIWGLCVVVALLLGVLGLGVGSTGWQSPWTMGGATSDPMAAEILWGIRAPRTVGAGLVGALLGLAGAVAQGLFRNPLAEPYLLGSSAGAGLCMAVLLTVGLPWMVAEGWWARVGLTGAAFVGALAGVGLTLLLARGAVHTMRLLLSGVVVGVVLGALTQLLMVWSGEAWRVMQAFMLGNTALLGWQACGVMALVLSVSLPVGLLLARVLDALSLGEDTARTLGVPLGLTRFALVAVMALATAAAVAQAGLVAFVGLVSPHLVRPWVGASHRQLLLGASLMGAVLLMAADVMARWLLAPQELPVGVLTAVLGGVYLLLVLHRRLP